jgi:hypothetical protein
MHRQRRLLASFSLAAPFLVVSACVSLKDNDFTQRTALEGGPGNAMPGSDGAPGVDGAGPDVPPDAPDADDRTDGDAGAGNDAGNDGSMLDSADSEAEACESPCSMEGTARCADQGTVQVCVVSAAGCMTWLRLGACASGTVCCQGLCRTDDTTLPAECVPLDFPPGYDLYVSATPIGLDAGTTHAHPAALDGSPDDDAQPPDASVSDATTDAMSNDGAPADARDGDASDRGSALHPFRTVTEALAAAKPLVESFNRVVRIYVARGTYDGTLGEVFPLIVPGGVTLEGAGQGRTVLAGTGYFNTTARGQTSYDTDIFVTMILGDVERPTRIADMTIEPGDSVTSRQHYGIYCDRGPAPVDGGTATPNTILSGLWVGEHYYYDIVSSTVLGGTGCALQLRASTIVGGKIGLFGICNQDFLPSGAFVVGDGTPEGGNTFEQQTTEDGDGMGLLSQCVPSVTASYNTFVDSNYGADVVGYVGADFSQVTTTLFHHNTFQRLSRYGLWLYGSGLVADVRDNSFTDISMRRFTTQTYGAFGLGVTGDSTPPYPVVTARNNKFINNDTGVYLQWSNTFLQAYTPPDFGRTDDPGNNVFHCNQATAVPDHIWGGSVLLDFYDVPEPVSFPFEGNQWDNSPPTRATATDNVFANYADIMVTNANSSARVTTFLPGLGSNCK